jgi:hypothetical protein
MRGELNARIGRTRPSPLADTLVAERGRGTRARSLRAGHIEAIPMNVRTFFVGALLVAGALFLAGHLVPLRPSGHASPPDRSATIEWPTHFRDRPLTQLPLGALEERCARRFPGTIARFTDGRRVLIVRQTPRPTRQLHPAKDCFRGIGYRVEPPQPAVDDLGERWSCFDAERDGHRVKVCERIHDGGAGEWTDAAAWFWASQYGGGPWWAVTVVTPIEHGT